MHEWKICRVLWGYIDWWWLSKKVRRCICAVMRKGRHWRWVGYLWWWYYGKFPRNTSIDTMRDAPSAAGHIKPNWVRSVVVTYTMTTLISPNRRAAACRSAVSLTRMLPPLSGKRPSPGLLTILRAIFSNSLLIDRTDVGREKDTVEVDVWADMMRLMVLN
jgi:hypothetical protein